MFNIVENAFIVQCPGVFAQLSMGQNLSTCTPTTLYYNFVFQNGHHENLIWTIYSVLIDVES